MAIKVRLELHDAAQCAILLQLAEGEEIAVPSAVLVHADQLPGRARSLDEGGGFGGCGDEGLLDEDVLPCLQRGGAEGEMRVGGCGDDDDVDGRVGEEGVG